MAKDEEKGPDEGWSRRRVQRWTLPKRRTALRGGASSRAKRRLRRRPRGSTGLTVAEVEEWRERFLPRPRTPTALPPCETKKASGKRPSKKLKQKVGELVLENDVLKEAVKPLPPFRTWDVRRVREAMPGLSRADRVRTSPRPALVDASRNREKVPGLRRRGRAPGGSEFVALSSCTRRYGYRLLWAMLRKDGVRTRQPQGRVQNP